jgi:hypothetical protein
MLRCLLGVRGCVRQARIWPAKEPESEQAGQDRDERRRRGDGEPPPSLPPVSLRPELLDRLDEPLDVVRPANIAQLVRLTRGQRLQYGRQHIGRRHPRVFDEHRHDRNTAFERRRNLRSHEIVGLIETPVPAVGGQPVVADDRDERVTRANGRFNRVDEVLARIDGAQIHEDVVAPEVSLEGIVQTPGVPRAVGASVTDENPHLGTNASA